MRIELTVEFLIIVGISLVIHGVLRRVYLDYRSLPPPEKPTEFNGKVLDTEELLGKVQQARAEMTAPKSPSPHPTFKRALMVESKREEIARLSFFQNPL